MQIKNLQLFLHLCESRNFAKTASDMHVSPSALTRQIQKLEDEIGQKLFMRDNRSVELSPAARKLQPVARHMLNDWQGYLREMQGTDQELRGKLRLFCSVTASYSHLPDILSEFRFLYPFIEFQLSTGDPAQAIEKILNEEVDIAISAKPEQLPAKIAFKSISQIPLSVIAPINTSAFHQDIESESFQEWDTIPFIVPEAGTARERANAWFKHQRIKPNIYAQIAGHEGIVSMVALGCGVGIVPDVVIENSSVREKVQKLNVSPIKPFELGICCIKSELENPLVKALWEVAKS